MNQQPFLRHLPESIRTFNPRLHHYLIAYASALVLANPMLIAAVVSDEGRSIRILLLSVAWFPAGLLAVVVPRYPMQNPIPVFIGYTAYFVIVIYALQSRTRAAFWIFLLALLLNIGGCHLQHSSFSHAF